MSAPGGVLEERISLVTEGVLLHAKILLHVSTGSSSYFVGA